MEAVGLVPAESMLAKYPYEMSGGQRQRVGFAQALALRPKLIVADEPVSMLDVSIRVGLLNLMTMLRLEEGVSFLYITHDIASARYVADRVLVMYAGRIVEQGPTEQLLVDPRHPYTKLLLQAAPDPPPRRLIFPVRRTRASPRQWSTRNRDARSSLVALWRSSVATRSLRSWPRSPRHSSPRAMWHNWRRAAL